MHSRIDIVRIETDCVRQFANGFRQSLQLRECQTEIVVRFRQIWIGHDGLLEFFQPARLIS